MNKWYTVKVKYDKKSEDGQEPKRVNEVTHAICSSKLSEILIKSKSNQDINKIIKRMINFIKSKGIKKFTYDYNIEINNELTPDTWKKKII